MISLLASIDCGANAVVAGEIADEVLVASTNEHFYAGFVTVQRREENGVIGLIATCEAAQGRGLGRALLAAAESWMRSQSLDHALVVTQADNHPRMRPVRTQWLPGRADGVRIPLLAERTRIR